MVRTCCLFQVLPEGRLRSSQEPDDHVLHLLLPRWSGGGGPLARLCLLANASSVCPPGRLQPSPSELLDRGAPPASLDLTLVKANSWLSGRKDAAERLLKNTSKTDVRGFFGGRLRSSMAKTE